MSDKYYGLLKLDLIILIDLLFQAQKPEQSVMQALESLNDSQVKQPLPWKMPLFEKIFS